MIPKIIMLPTLFLFCLTSFAMEDRKGHGQGGQSGYGDNMELETAGSPNDLQYSVTKRSLKAAVDTIDAWGTPSLATMLYLALLPFTGQKFSENEWKEIVTSAYAKQANEYKTYGSEMIAIAAASALVIEDEDDWSDSQSKSYF